MYKEEGKSNLDKKGSCTMLNLILLGFSNQELSAPCNDKPCLMPQYRASTQTTFDSLHPLLHFKRFARSMQ